MNFKYKIFEFMRGRYGVDKTFYVLFVLSAVLAFANCFVRSLVLQLIVYAIIVVAFLRFFSKNIDARIKENNIVTKYIDKLSKTISVKRERSFDKDHIYKKCPNCKATLRLPRKKGKHTTVCPICKKKFNVFVFK